jgi:hypothetical protein
VSARLAPKAIPGNHNHIPTQKSTRACLRSESPSGSGRRNICDLSLGSPASSAGGRHRTRIMSALPNRRGWPSRSATNSLSLSAPSITPRTMPPGTNDNGGRSGTWIRWLKPKGCGAKAKAEVPSSTPQAEGPLQNWLAPDCSLALAKAGPSIRNLSAADYSVTQPISGMS